MENTSSVRALKGRRAPTWDAGVSTLASLAEPLGLRVYRDQCGDENIPGRFGEVYRYGPGTLAVQFGGALANGKIRTGRRKIRWRIQSVKRLPGLRLFIQGEDEAVFHFPDALLPEVGKLIWAYQAYGAARRSETAAKAA